MHLLTVRVFTFASTDRESQCADGCALLILDGKFTRFGNLMDQAYGSFIERRFMVALLMGEAFSFEPMARPPHAVARDAFGITLGYQVPVGPYFVDFTLTHTKASLRLAVELDGHGWHRRTAKEAEYEARRERLLADAGWTVVRYMGAEVLREPGRVAREAYEKAHRQLRPGLTSATALTVDAHASAKR